MAELSARACCAPERRRTCCEPAAKADCCDERGGCDCATDSAFPPAADARAQAGGAHVQADEPGFG